MKPRISVIMGTYNRAHLIEKAVQSVQKQSFSDWELIIADDGSSDDTEIVANKLKKVEPRIIYIKNPVNQGISKNYNTAFRVASGEYIAMIDDDDSWSDTAKLEKQAKFLDMNPDYVGCGGGIIVVNDQGRELYRYFKPETDEEIRNHMLFSNPMANSTTLFRRKAGESINFYDETLLYSGDRDFWLKMGLLGKLYNFPIYFSYYTMNENNTSIVKIRPHLQTSFFVMKRFKRKYPHYFSALFFNKIQYLYAVLPKGFRNKFHRVLASLKHAVAR